MTAQASDLTQLSTTVRDANCFYCTVLLFIVQEAAGVAIEPKAWPPLLDTDDVPKKKLHNVFHVDSPDQLCYVDFSVSTTGMLTGAKVCNNTGYT